jgi:hypothetical protein
MLATLETALGDVLTDEARLLGDGLAVGDALGEVLKDETALVSDDRISDGELVREEMLGDELLDTLLVARLDRAEMLGEALGDALGLDGELDGDEVARLALGLTDALLRDGLGDDGDTEALGDALGDALLDEGLLEALGDNAADERTDDGLTLLDDDLALDELDDDTEPGVQVRITWPSAPAVPFPATLPLPPPPPPGDDPGVPVAPPPSTP